jgi:hypothetical protein
MNPSGQGHDDDLLAKQVEQFAAGGKYVPIDDAVGKQEVRLDGPYRLSISNNA